MIATEIIDALDELAFTCGVITRAEKCEKCPLKADCLMDYSILDTVRKIPGDSLQTMLDLAELLTDREIEAEKTEEQRRWEAEADYWNDRRCDPDYGDE